MFGYVAFFAISIGPLGWLVISEIFPQKVRGLGTSIGSLAVWIFNCIVSFTFFKIIDFFLYQVPKLLLDKRLLRIRQVHFFLYGFIAVLGLVWGYLFLPETKGLSLEEIEQKWRKNREC